MGATQSDEHSSDKAVVSDDRARHLTSYQINKSGMVKVSDEGEEVKLTGPNILVAADPPGVGVGAGSRIQRGHLRYQVIPFGDDRWKDVPASKSITLPPGRHSVVIQEVT